MCSKTEKIKLEIIKQYGSVRKFADKLDIPSTTLISALSRGIGGMGFDKVAKICQALNLDILTFEKVDTELKNIELPQDKQNLLDNYDKLNEVGKEKAIERVEELTHMDKYTNTEQKDECPIDHDIARKYFLYIDKKTNQPVFSIPFFDVLNEIQKNSDMVTEQLIAYGGSGNFLREISREEAEMKKKAIEEALNNKRDNSL